MPIQGWTRSRRLCLVRFHGYEMLSSKCCWVNYRSFIQARLSLTPWLTLRRESCSSSMARSTDARTSPISIFEIVILVCCRQGQINKSFLRRRQGDSVCRDTRFEEKREKLEKRKKNHKRGEQEKTPPLHRHSITCSPKCKTSFSPLFADGLSGKR